MKRKRKIADLILISDLHLRETAPVSRVDDYMEAQENKLKFLSELQSKNEKCPILCAGDIFDYWKASPGLCAWAYNWLPDDIITIPGNHDLPMHSMEEYKRSALYLMEKVGKIRVLNMEHYEQTIQINGMEITGVPFGKIEEFSAMPRQKMYTGTRNILILHHLVFPSRPPHWAAHAYSGPELMEEFEDFDLIITGDNHQSFVVQSGEDILVNPGSMMRMEAAQVEMEPKCYLYYAKENRVRAVNFPIEKNVHNTDYLERVKDRENRIEAYISKINHGWEGGLSFTGNLNSFFEKNKIPWKVREIIWEHMEQA